MKSLLHLVPWLALVVSPSLALPDQPAHLDTQLLHTRDAKSSSSSSNTTCATLHMIVARGSLEAPGEGFIIAVANQVQSAIPGSDSDGVPYPATLDNYISSESKGVASMQSLIVSYEARCPNSKIALLGYSQGAHVVGDVLCGTSEAHWNSTPPESPALSKNIIASIQMGDPSFALNQPQDVGTATKGGIFKRNNTAACPSSIMKSYCDFNDTYCDTGKSILVHVSYVKVYGDVAAQWIIEKYGAANETNTTTSSATPTSTSPAGTSTTASTTNSADRLRGTSTILTGILGFLLFSVCVGM
jgi:acetylxylan esterase